MPRLPFGDIGTAEIIWGYGESALAISLAPFFGTVTLRMEDTIHDVQEEGYGEASVDAVSGGAVVELDVPMTRSTLEQLEAVLQGTLASTVLTLTSRAGCAMYEDSKALVIKPVCDNVPSTNPAEWILIFHAHPYRKFELAFDRSTQRVFLVGFKVFPAQETGHVGEYLTIGV